MRMWKKSFIATMFPTVVNLIGRIKDEEEDIVPERQT